VFDKVYTTTKIFSYVNLKRTIWLKGYQNSNHVELKT